jgi:hypothetical protein
MTLKIGRSHKARKALFARGIRRGFLVIGEIDDALPPGSLTDAERWLLFYSLKAARVEVRDADGNSIELDDRPVPEHDGAIDGEAEAEAEADQQQ